MPWQTSTEGGIAGMMMGVRVTELKRHRNAEELLRNVVNNWILWTCNACSLKRDVRRSLCHYG